MPDLFWDRVFIPADLRKTVDRSNNPYHDIRRTLDLGDAFPEIVCLCGSTRFMEAFQAANLRLTLAGKIVLSVGCNTKSDVGLGITPEVKVMLDDLHKRKIDMADSVLVLNVGGYIGDSTRSEVEYAKRNGKRVEYLEPV